MYFGALWFSIFYMSISILYLRGLRIEFQYIKNNIYEKSNYFICYSFIDSKYSSSRKY
ncbi:hypothetical protein EMIT036CA2_20380 [Chryseobacterium sp. IT-36CA2]